MTTRQTAPPTPPTPPTQTTHTVFAEAIEVTAAITPNGPYRTLPQNPSVFKKIEGLGKEEGVGRQFAKEAIEDGLASLEAKYTSRGATGPFMCGQSPSVADICLVPQLYNGRRFGVDLAAVCPALLAVDEACAESEYFKASHPDGQPDADMAEPPKKKAKA